jgi:hypothetical protein
MARVIPYLLPLTVLIIWRHAAAAWLLDVIGGPLPPWQVASFSMLFLVEMSIVGIVFCFAVLVWNYVCFELPANRRRKARP